MNVERVSYKSRMFYVFTLLLILSEINVSVLGACCIVLMCLLIFINHGTIAIGSMKYAIISWTYLMIAGVIVGLFNNITTRDFIRDIYYVIIPIFYIILAYNWSKMGVVSKEMTKECFVNAAKVLSCLHISLLIFLYKLDFMASRGGIMGFESIVTCIGFYFLLVSKKDRYRHKIIWEFLMLLSIGMYVSRTLLIMLVILGVTVYAEYFKTNFGKIIKAVIVVLIFGVILNAILPQSVTQYFVTKILNSFTEISVKQNWDISTINTNWRGYERYLIINELKGANLINQLFGFGFGKRLNLNLSINLAGTVYNDIPTFHSGFYYILYKTGVLGIVAFIFFFVALFLQVRDIKDKNVKKINLGVLYFSFIQMFVSTGFLGAGSYAGIMLLLGLCIGSKGVKE